MEATVSLRLAQSVKDSGSQLRLAGVDVCHTRIPQQSPQNWPSLLVVEEGDDE